MAIVAITSALLARLDREVATVREKGVHRPTVALVIRHVKSGRFLIVEGKKDRIGGAKNPGVVKGGVDAGEHIIEAAYREVDEEIRVNRSEIDIIGYCGSYSVYSVKKKENFDCKRYFVFYAKYDGSRKLAIDDDEIIDYVWVKLGDIGRILRPLRKRRIGKHKVLLKVFSEIRRTKQKCFREIEQLTKSKSAS